jgi:hypothetical protein
MILKSVIHYADTNSVEATWVDTKEHVVKCHSYADVQMNMLRADLGADAAEYADLIATVEANIKPVVIVPPTPLEQLAQLDAANMLTQRNLRDFILLTVEALKLGQPIDLSPVLGISKVIAVEAQAVELRKQL